MSVQVAATAFWVALVILSLVALKRWNESTITLFAIVGIVWWAAFFGERLYEIWH